MGKKQSNKPIAPKHKSNPEPQRHPVISVISVISGASQFIAAAALGWGFGTMNTSFGLLIWVMGGGALFLSVAILTNEYINLVLSKINIFLRLFITVVLCAVLVGGAVLFTSNKIDEHIQQLLYTATFQGHLESGDLATPIPLPSDVPQDTLTVMLGGARVLAHPNQPYIIGVEGTPALSFYSAPDGHMSLNITIVDKAQNELLTINDGVFKVKSDGVIPILSGNSTLSIQDYNGKLIVYISYLNKSSIRIYGDFYFKGVSVPLTVIPNGKIKSGHLTILGNNSTIKGVIDLYRFGGIALH